METAIGVFSLRDHAEQAVRELQQQSVPDEAIVFLSRSENETRVIAKHVGATVGGFVGGAAGMSAGVAVASLLLPGIGAVFALGFGAAALLGLAGAGAGAGVGQAATREGNVPQPTPDEKCSEDVRFFREVLKEGRSLIVVRTESPEVAATACAILDRLGLGLQGRIPVRMQTSMREVGDVVVLEVGGRITLGEGNMILRDVVRDLVDKGNRKFVMNLAEVLYVDSSGLGELVKAHATVSGKGGQLKLVSLNQRVHDLLQMTRLIKVFDIHADESSAIQSFGGAASVQAVA